MPRGLRRGPPASRHRGGIERKREPRGDFVREQRRLVEAAPPEPPPMERDRDDDIIVRGFYRQLVAEKFRERTPNRLIESILMTTNQRGQTVRLVLGSGAVACDRMRDSIVRALGEAARASFRAASDGFERPAANLASRKRHLFDAFDALRTDPPPIMQRKSISTSSTARRIQKIQNLKERSHYIDQFLPATKLKYPSKTFGCRVCRTLTAGNRLPWCRPQPNP
jgi:hypothetical protein